MSAADPPHPVPAPQTGEGDAPSASAPAVPSATLPAAPSGRLCGPHNELLSRIWHGSLPLLRERLAVLDRAAHLASLGDLPSPARTDAADLAHKLAGSLGMFGFPLGTEIAREMEQLLDADAPPDGARLLVLALRLRAALPV